MSVKLIVMDMDGTLLRSDNTIDDATKKSLIHLEKKGVRLVLASGRSYFKLMDYAKELQMDKFNGYLIEVNGMFLYDLKEKKRLRFSSLKLEDIQKIYQGVQSLNLETMCLMDDTIYDWIPQKVMERKKEYIKEHGLSKKSHLTAGAFKFINDNSYPNVYYINDYHEVKEETNKICIAGEPNEIENAYLYCKKIFKNQYWVGRTSPRWLEICPLEVTKGRGLERLLNITNIKSDEVMAFGDGENDIEMLTLVKYGIAMKNSLESVKKIAFDICESNNDLGIQKTLEKYKEHFIS